MQWICLIHDIGTDILLYYYEYSGTDTFLKTMKWMLLDGFKYLPKGKVNGVAIGLHFRSPPIQSLTYNLNNKHDIESIYASIFYARIK